MPIICAQDHPFSTYQVLNAPINKGTQTNKAMVINKYKIRIKKIWQNKAMSTIVEITIIILATPKHQIHLEIHSFQEDEILQLWDNLSNQLSKSFSITRLSPYHRRETTSHESNPQHGITHIFVITIGAKDIRLTIVKHYEIWYKT